MNEELEEDEITQLRLTLNHIAHIIVEGELEILDTGLYPSKQGNATRITHTPTGLYVQFGFEDDSKKARYCAKSMRYATNLIMMLIYWENRIKIYGES